MSEIRDFPPRIEARAKRILENIDQDTGDLGLNEGIDLFWAIKQGLEQRLPPSDNLHVVVQDSTPPHAVHVYRLNVHDDYPKTTWPNYERVSALIERRRAQERNTKPFRMLYAIAGEDTHVECDWSHLYKAK